MPPATRIITLLSGLTIPAQKPRTPTHPLDDEEEQLILRFRFCDEEALESLHTQDLLHGHRTIVSDTNPAKLALRQILDMIDDEPMLLGAGRHPNAETSLGGHLPATWPRSDRRRDVGANQSANSCGGELLGQKTVPQSANGLARTPSQEQKGNRGVEHIKLLDLEKFLSA